MNPIQRWTVIAAKDHRINEQIRAKEVRVIGKDHQHIDQFILKHEDKDRNQLKSAYPDFQKFMKDFNVNEDLQNQLISYAESEGLKLNRSEFDKSAEMIKILIKSYLARDLWTSSEFYRIFNEKDPIFLKAFEIIRNPDMYTKKLQAYKGD